MGDLIAANNTANPAGHEETPTTRGYQQELLEESLRGNIIIALDTGSGKTHIAVLRMKIETEREPTKISWFLAPTVALCEQQRTVIQISLPVSVGLISGSMEPDQWKDPGLWTRVLSTNRVLVTTPQILLDALRHGYVKLGSHISLLVFDEAHHAVGDHPYSRIMQEFYFKLPPRSARSVIDDVRPCILGLSASPIYGGDVERAFKTIEENLDSMIRSARSNRDELAQYVHRPTFKHVMYDPPCPYDPPFSTNLAALKAVLSQLDIDNDPYVSALRDQLGKVSYGTSEYNRLDQKLSKVLVKQDTFTHKGLRDFERTAEAILVELGSWAADWYVWEVIQKAKKTADPFNNIISSWKSSEKTYLLGIIDKIVVSPVSYHAADIQEESSDKVQKLIQILLEEKFSAEAENEAYSGLVFVKRRDVVLALTNLLKVHPFSASIFDFGCLLGSSSSAYRRSFLDITRSMLEQTPENTLADFRTGTKNVIISTAVAEEGIDIQACGSVIRWDPPMDMASWAQSRGRARKKKSTFTLIFENGGDGSQNVLKWENLEREMVKRYNDPTRLLQEELEETAVDEDDLLEFRVPTTGALLTPHSAVSHLSHFCAAIPSSSHTDTRPLYDVDPPEMPIGWHQSAKISGRALPPPYQGPFGSKVTLPRSIPIPVREFSTERIFRTKISAHRHAAFTAYKALYEKGLLNDNLLPPVSMLEPEKEEEVKAMLEAVEKRTGMANVDLQMDPWAPAESENQWWEYELLVEGLPALRMFNMSKKIVLRQDEGPVLYQQGKLPVQTWLRFVGMVESGKHRIAQAKEYTRMIFWCLNGSRMIWDQLDFCYLFLPASTDGNELWSLRRLWHLERNAECGLTKHEDEYVANAADFGHQLGYATDLTIVKNGPQFSKGYRFVRWRYEPLTTEEEADVRKYYKRFADLEITYPLLVVEQLSARVNFLIPSKAKADTPGPAKKSLLLVPQLSSIILLSAADIEFSFILPSILRSLAMSLTVSSLRDSLFISSPLSKISDELLTTAITAPMSQEKWNYQRLETLGDTVLKFVVGIQLLAEYPLWPEGFLTKQKDHLVSNVRLAKENIKRGLYRWIIRDRMLGKKWKPRYFSVEVSRKKPPATGKNGECPHGKDQKEVVEEKVNKGKGAVRDPKVDGSCTQNEEQRNKRKEPEELSTKILADIVESIIGAAYLHGGLDLGYECVKFFNLGWKKPWQPIPARVNALLSHIEDPETLISPPQLAYIEQIIGYTFKRKLLLIEALTHASYDQNLELHTSSYERMEFLGDSVLDMIVTDFLYHAPGKNYSPGHMHLRKSAVVNGHFLAYICLASYTEIDAVMPRKDHQGEISEEKDKQKIHLWKCLLHSSPRILDDLTNTSFRFQRGRTEIEEALQTGTIFPWAALTRLQAPKFFSDMIESILGAVYLDSDGCMHIVKRVLRILGVMRVLQRIVADDVDILHPVSRLGMWASRHEKSVEYIFPKEKGKITCAILIDGEVEATCTEVYRGQASQEEVRFVAAEQAIKSLKLRDGEEDGKSKRTKKKESIKAVL